MLHIRYDQSLVSFVELLDGDHLNVRRNVVLSTEVEHLLGFGNADDSRAGQTAAAEDQTERRDRQRLFKGAHERNVAVDSEQLDVGIDIYPTNRRS